ncbi:MAG: hypothetical protein OEY64_10680 [Nitrospinota bacterium]|nr:hypothetical protein [Nitrospinota bacterium]
MTMWWLSSRVSEANVAVSLAWEKLLHSVRNDDVVVVIASKRSERGGLSCVGGIASLRSQ